MAVLIGYLRLLCCLALFVSGWGAIAQDRVEPAAQTGGNLASAAPAQSCLPGPLRVLAAPALGDSLEVPESGWELVELPDAARQRWPGYNGPVWYDLHWELPCVPGNDQPLALFVEYMNMAGEIWINDQFLWMDRHLAEPISRSWNMPRQWLLPQSSLRAGDNRLLIRIIDSKVLGPAALGSVEIGAREAIQSSYDGYWWSRRGMYVLNAVVTFTMGSMFFFVWLVRRKDHTSGWFTLMCMCWVAFVSHVLMDETAPFRDSLALARVNLGCFIWYCWALCRFSWSFSDQELPRLKRWLLWLCSACSLLLLIAPAVWMTEYAGLTVMLLIFTAVFFGNCLQFIWHTWTRRNREHLPLALCYGVFLLIGLHDIFLVFRPSSEAQTMTAMATLATSLAMSLTLGRRTAQNIHRIEGFNQELHSGIANAQAHLAQILEREHLLALSNTKLQERIRIAHDLHDGLGASLVRSMAQVEQVDQPLESRQVLSILKLLRDDLRQVIDADANSQAQVPENPMIWIAPVRHRFVRLFDELDVATRWDLPTFWQVPPTAVQCLMMMRIVEEALSNMLKHSRANLVQLRLQFDEGGGWHLEIEDNGRGFDVEAVLQAGLSVGMRSMQARAQRLGGRMVVVSKPGQTLILVQIPGQSVGAV